MTLIFQIVIAILVAGFALQLVGFVFTRTADETEAVSLGCAFLTFIVRAAVICVAYVVLARSSVLSGFLTS